MFWMIILCFVVLIGLAMAIYAMPDQAVKAKKKKEKAVVAAQGAPALDTSKDWKTIAERWEKHNQSLLGQVEKMKMDHKTIGQEVDAYKAEIKAMTEKLALEKSWREKEQTGVEKLKNHEKDLKDQIGRTESELEKEHSNRLRLEREWQDLKVKYDQIIEEKRQLSIKAASLQTTVETNTREIKELKADNTQLKEKRADIQWVAKSEFDELKKAFVLQEQQLARLKESHG